MKDKLINEQSAELSNLQKLTKKSLEIKAFERVISNLQVQLNDARFEIQTKEILNVNLESELQKAQHNIEALNEAHSKELASAQERYQNAIDDMHARFEGVQKHMQLQISEARDEAKRYKLQTEQKKFNFKKFSIKHWRAHMLQIRLYKLKKHHSLNKLSNFTTNYWS